MALLKLNHQQVMMIVTRKKANNLRGDDDTWCHVVSLLDLTLLENQAASKDQHLVFALQGACRILTQSLAH